MKCVDMVTGKTSVFGILGNPVSHSFSPVLHNTIAAWTGENLIYVPFPAERGGLSEAVRGGYHLGIAGFNVTVPYKTEVLPLLQEIEPMAERIGAVNTLQRIEGGYKGYNTDILGLETCMQIHKISVENKTVAVIGAGGAARAAVLAVERGQAKRLLILNRTREKAESLARLLRDVPVEIYGYEEFHSIPKPEIVLQTTSVGMGEGCRDTPISTPSFFEKAESVIDMIYIPWETTLLAEAKKWGAKTVNGFAMLIYQGIASYEIWHGMKISPERKQELYQYLSLYYRGGK